MRGVVHRNPLPQLSVLQKPSSFLRFLSSNRNQDSFTVSYLINSLRFYPDAALAALLEKFVTYFKDELLNSLSYRRMNEIANRMGRFIVKLFMYGGMYERVGGRCARVMGRKMEWAAQAYHMGGIPRKMVIMAVGAFAKLVANTLNTTSVYNADTLLSLVRSRPPGVPLITVSNHKSTLDDPVMWGFKGFPTIDANLARWVLAAEDICFKNIALSYFFRLGKCIPITRGAGIYQEHMNEALDHLSNGAWLHTFPEGKVFQEDAPIRRLKWGTASLIARAPISPIILPIVHHGFEKVMPENFFGGRRPPFPLFNKKIKIVIGEPMEFDLPRLREMAVRMSRDSSFHDVGWPSPSSCRLDERAQRCLYATISERIRTAMESLRCHAKTFQRS